VTSHSRRAAVFGVLAGLAGLSMPAIAQEWPRKPITIIVPYNAGGGADAVSRLLAFELTKRLGQQVLVDNRPGANGNLGTAMVARAAPDGYTLLLIPPNPIINSKLLYKSLPYDPERDLTPIMKLVESPFAVMAYPPKHPDIQSLLAFAKAHPGELNVAVAGNGSSGHLLALMIAASAGVRFNIVPYKGSGQMVSEIVSGRIDMTVDYPSAYLGQIEAGHIRVLATLGETRSQFLPDAPTMKESGYPDVLGTGWFSLHGPRGLPDELVTRLQKAFSDALRTPAIVSQLATLGYSVVPGTPAELRALIGSETARLAALIKDANISLE
jgi:tripartite-type tricarboxylate transporter receptor subunit TctC